jgi:hypothetical protein
LITQANFFFVAKEHKLKGNYRKEEREREREREREGERRKGVLIHFCAPF